MRGAPCGRFSRLIVERRLDADDNRVRRIWLTPKGTRLAAKLNVAAQQHVSRLMTGFSR